MTGDCHVRFDGSGEGKFLPATLLGLVAALGTESGAMWWSHPVPTQSRTSGAPPGGRTCPSEVFPLLSVFSKRFGMLSVHAKGIGSLDQSQDSLVNRTPWMSCACAGCSHEPSMGDGVRGLRRQQRGPQARGHTRHLAQITTNSLAFRLQDPQFASEIYPDIREPAVGSSERWREAVAIHQALTPGTTPLKADNPQTARAGPRSDHCSHECPAEGRGVTLQPCRVSSCTDLNAPSLCSASNVGRVSAGFLGQPVRRS
jgi:hypothetical protein